MQAFFDSESQIGLKRHVIANRDGCMVREFFALVDGLRAGQCRNRRGGQVVADASKNPRLAGL